MGGNYIRVLSLFDGMSCGQIAMHQLGIDIERYVAYEIDKYAIKVTTHNFPGTEECGNVFEADFKQYQGFDWLIGGSPCTYWSICQTKNREIEASGLGWELFSQYVRALREARPEFFLYENNKSMSPAIRKQISETFGFDPIMINSSLVSAQNRERLYWVGHRTDTGYEKVEMPIPEDRGILLIDVIDLVTSEKGYALKSLTEREMDYMVRPTKDGRNHFDFQYFHDAGRDKSSCVTANIHKGVPYNVIVEPVRIGTIENAAKNSDFDSQQYRVYSPIGKSVTLCEQGGGVGAKTGLYIVPTGVAWRGRNNGSSYEIRNDQKSNVITASGHQSRMVIEEVRQGEFVGTNNGTHDNYEHPVYQVVNRQILIKGTWCPVRLDDGFYVIRKLTVKECKRLQTVPEWYDMNCISNTQAYKCLGNGWTVEVIMHLIQHSMNQ